VRGNRWVSVVALGAAAVLTAGAGACAGGRISLGTSAGVCFRALPPAESVVHEKGKLIGVRRVKAATLKARLPHDATLATLPDQDLCVFAFNGAFLPGTVTGAQNTMVGHYAIIAVSTNNPAVVGAFVVDTLPTRFAHLH
jgi:hypothetical protein